MNDQTFAQIQKQLDDIVASPARTYGSLMLDHLEQLWGLQYEAAQTYTAASVQCARAALEISDPSDVQAYVENQKRLATEISERVKNDADKMVSLNQTFVLKAQKVAEDSARSMSQAAEDGARELMSAAQQDVKSTSGKASQAK